MCKSVKELRSLKDQEEDSKLKEQSDEEEAYNINLFRIKTSEQSGKFINFLKRENINDLSIS